MPRTKAKPDPLTAARPPFQRMMQIHSAISAGQFPNAQDLAGELEVTWRTIMRDIEFMRDRLELPIDYDALHRGFYYTREVAAFPAFQITEGELFALLVAEKAMEQYRGTSFEKPLVSAFKKVAESLPEVISFNLSEWEGSVSFRTSAQPILNLEVFDLLARATARRERLKLHYQKPGTRKSEVRLIDPYHLANVNGEWFLFAWDHLRKAIRTFVPARVKKIERTGIHFKRDPRFSIEKELSASFGIHSGSGEFKVIIRFNELVSDYIREKTWHPSQKLRELADGGVELRMKLSSLVEVQRWILGWGGNASVISPPELAQNLRDSAQRILERHKKPVTGL
jgi:predicted DNA-binding transcriptional regulator YafY